jgi:cellulose synthase/poly-beta-1,6-N-acetylglucosamine synthase-like glycosyltransferase
MSSKDKRREEEENEAFQKVLEIPNDVNKLRSMCIQLILENRKLRSEIKMLKEKTLAMEELLEGVREEVEGLLRGKVLVNQLANEKVLSFKQIYGSIISAARHLNQRRFFVFTKWMFYTIVFMSAFIFFTIYPQYLELIIYSITGNPIIFVLILGIIALLIYYKFKK